ncbi:hypothetical protein B7463_g3128, partial [Scytalidium lignicola]
MSLQLASLVCDGTTPSCSNCVNKNRECRYLAGDDRRKLSLRVAIELLSQRVDQLTQFILDNGLQVPALSEHEEASLRKVLTMIGLPYENLTGRRIQPGSDGHQGDIGDINLMQNENGGPNAPEAAVTNSDSSESQTLNKRSRTEHQETQQPMSSQEAPALNFTCQIPSGGQPSPNSNSSGQIESALGLTDTNAQNTSLPYWDWTNIGGQGQAFNINDASRFSSVPQNSYPNASAHHRSYNDVLIERSPPPSTDDIDDSDSVEELVDQLADRMGTLHIGADGQIRYYGPTSNFTLMDMPSTDPMHIHRSIRNDGQEYLDRLGVGASVPPDLEDHLINLYFTWQDPPFHIVDREMYESGKRKWYEEAQDTPYYSEALRNAIAKALIEIDLDAPCLATAQAMVVTSCHDMGCTRDARGWLYSGMAIRLAFDLALHKDMTAYVAKGIISQAEAEVRRTVFWGAYLVDQVWSFHLGRQFRINMDDVTCGKPGRNLSQPVNRQWTPYVTLSTSPTPMTDYLEEVTGQRVLLCEIMAPLGQNLYGTSGIDPHLLQELNAKTVVELFDWRENIPTALRVDLDDTTTPYLPHVLLMYMHYYQCLIYAHRPWMSRSNIQPQPPQGPGFAHARQICVDAAISIARLLQLYEQRYTLRRMNIQGPAITCSAALLLIFAEISHYGRSQGLNIAQHLGVCFRALDEFGQSWESARRSRVFLTRLQRQWELQARQKRSARRLSKEVSDSSRKRPLTATDFDAHQGNHHAIWQGNTHQQLQSEGINGAPDPDLDMNFDWMLGVNAQTVSRSWATGPYSRLAPSDLMGFLEDV